MRYILIYDGAIAGEADSEPSLPNGYTFVTYKGIEPLGTLVYDTKRNKVKHRDVPENASWNGQEWETVKPEPTRENPAFLGTPLYEWAKEACLIDPRVMAAYASALAAESSRQYSILETTLATLKEMKHEASSASRA